MLQEASFRDELIAWCYLGLETAVEFVLPLFSNLNYAIRLPPSYVELFPKLDTFVSPVAAAAEGGRAEVLKALLARGASPHHYSWGLNQARPETSLRYSRRVLQAHHGNLRKPPSKSRASSLPVPTVTRHPKVKRRRAASPLRLSRPSLQAGSFAAHALHFAATGEVASILLDALGGYRSGGAGGLLDRGLHVRFLPLSYRPCARLCVMPSSQSWRHCSRARVCESVLTRSPDAAEACCLPWSFFTGGPRAHGGHSSADRCLPRARRGRPDPAEAWGVRLRVQRGASLALPYLAHHSAAIP